MLLMPLYFGGNSGGGGAAVDIGLLTQSLQSGSRLRERDGTSEMEQVAGFLGQEGGASIFVRAKHKGAAAADEIYEKGRG